MLYQFINDLFVIFFFRHLYFRIILMMMCIILKSRINGSERVECVVRICDIDT